MSKDHIIVGIHINERAKQASEVQDVLTEHGCSIKTRIGLHTADEKCCSPAGLVLIEFVGGGEMCSEMVEKLGNIGGVDVQKMEFSHS